MKKILLGLILLFGIIILAIGVYLITSRLASPAEVTTEDIRQAYLTQGSIICEFEESDIGSWGKLWVKNGIVKGEINTDPEQEPTNIEPQSELITLNFLIKGEHYYFWPTQKGQGMVMSADRNLDDWLFRNVDDPEQFTQDVEARELDCRFVDLDDQLFEIPSEIEFLNQEEILEPTHVYDEDKMKEELLKELREKEGMKDLSADDLKEIMKQWEETMDMDAAN